MSNTIWQKGARGQIQPICHFSEAHGSVRIQFDVLKGMGISSGPVEEVTVSLQLTRPTQRNGSNATWFLEIQSIKNSKHARF